jgi:hypothetical protein
MAVNAQKRPKSAVPAVWHGPCYTSCNRNAAARNISQGANTMFNMNEWKQGLVAAFAALILTTTAVGAAVGPAEAVDGPILAAASIDSTVRG